MVIPLNRAVNADGARYPAPVVLAMDGTPLSLSLRPVVSSMRSVLHNENQSHIIVDAYRITLRALAGNLRVAFGSRADLESMRSVDVFYVQTRLFTYISNVL